MDLTSGSLISMLTLTCLFAELSNTRYLSTQLRQFISTAPLTLSVSPPSLSTAPLSHSVLHPSVSEYYSPHSLRLPSLSQTPLSLSDSPHLQWLSTGLQLVLVKGPHCPVVTSIAVLAGQWAGQCLVSVLPVCCQ